MFIFGHLQEPDSASQILYSWYDNLVIGLVLQKRGTIIQGFQISRECRRDKRLTSVAVCNV